MRRDEVKIQVNRSILTRLALVASLIAHLATISTRLCADDGSCGGASITVPFTDVAGSVFFCDIAEAFFSGLTSVTTVFSGMSHPHGIIFDGSNIWVTDRGDNTLKKLDQSGNILLSVSVGGGPRFPAFDGENIWVPSLECDGLCSDWQLCNGLQYRSIRRLQRRLELLDHISEPERDRAVLRMPARGYEISSSSRLKAERQF